MMTMMKKKMRKSLKSAVKKEFEFKDSLGIISKDLNHSRTGGSRIIISI